MPARTGLAGTPCHCFGKTRSWHAFTRSRPARWTAAPSYIPRNGASHAALNEPVSQPKRRQLLLFAGVLTASSQFATTQLASASEIQAKRRNLSIEQLKDIIAVSNHTISTTMLCTHLHHSRRASLLQHTAHKYFCLWMYEVL